MRANEDGDEAEREVPNKYVVFAPLAWSGANKRFISGYLRNAVDRLNEELAYDGEIKFIDAQIQNGPNGEIPVEWWNPTLDQEEVFDDLLEALVEMPEDGVKEFILDQMDEDDPTLSNAHFVFTHDVGDIKEPPSTGTDGPISIGISIGGWGGKTPVHHGPIADQEMHATLLGPSGLLDPRGLYGDACVLTLLENERPTWKGRRLAWQSVGHAFGADHTDGGYYLTGSGEEVQLVSIMASGHLFDRRGRQDMRTKDGDPFFDIGDAARNDDGTVRTERGELVEDPPVGSPRRKPLADFQGWGGGSNPVLSAEHPLDTDAYPEAISGIEDPEEIEDFEVWSGCVEVARGRQMKPIHPKTFTDRSLSKMEETIAFSPPGLSVDVYEPSEEDDPAGEFIRADDEFVLEAFTRNVDTDRIDGWEAALLSGPSDDGDGDSEDGPAIDDLVVETADEEGRREYTLAAEDAGDYEIEVTVLPPDDDPFEQSGVEYDSLSATATVTVAPPLTAAIDVGDGEAGVGETVVLDGGDSEGEIASYTWYVDGPDTGGDVAELLGQLGEGEVIEREFHTPGAYEVELTIEEEDTEASASATATFDVAEGEDGEEDEEPPEEFTVAIDGPEAVEQHTAATFAAEVEFTTTAVTSYEWGGVASGTSRETVERFEEQGNYEVTLVAENRSGDVDETVHEVAVTDAPRPEVELEGPEETTVDTTVEYVADAAVDGGEITSYEWSGGIDGSITDTATVEADAPGTVDVAVVVTADTGATNTARRTLDVRSEDGDGRPPTVSIAGPRTVERGSTETYEAVADDDGEITAYEWDGAATGTDDSVEVAFEDLATHALEVSVTDDDNRTSTASTAVAVTSTPPEDNETPGVEIVGPEEALEGESAEFTAVADDADGSIATYDWNIEGGGETVTTTFDAPGLRTVQVTVTDTQGGTTTAGLDVRVRPRQGPAPDLTAAMEVPDAIPVEEAVTFDAAPSIGADEYRWSLEKVLPFRTNAGVPLSDADGETVTITFEEAATYALTLTVEGGDDKEDATTEVFDAAASTFLDTFADGDLSEYSAAQGSKDNWNVEPKLQGNSAHVDASGGGNQTIVADGFEWTGTGTVEFDFQLAPGFSQNAKITMGSRTIPDAIRVRIALGGGSQLIRAGVGDSVNTSSGVSLDSTARHHATVTVTESEIAVSVDGSVRHTADVSDISLPSGPVGMSVNSNSSRGTETWFDNLYVESG